MISTQNASPISLPDVQCFPGGSGFLVVAICLRLAFFKLFEAEGGLISVFAFG